LHTDSNNKSVCPFLYFKFIIFLAIFNNTSFTEGIHTKVRTSMLKTYEIIPFFFIRSNLKKLNSIKLDLLSVVIVIYLNTNITHRAFIVEILNVFSFYCNFKFPVSICYTNRNNYISIKLYQSSWVTLFQWLCNFHYAF